MDDLDKSLRDGILETSESPFALQHASVDSVPIDLDIYTEVTLPADKGTFTLPDQQYLALPPLASNRADSRPRALTLEIGNEQQTYFIWNRGYSVVTCLLYTSPSPRDRQKSRMPSSA